MGKFEKKIFSKNYKIKKKYSYRVDSVHNETYKILGGLHRTELEGAIFIFK